MSHLTRMLGLTVHNFVSAATGPATAAGEPTDARPSQALVSRSAAV